MSHKYRLPVLRRQQDMRELLGGKGANLAEMTRAGMPVPQGFHCFYRSLHTVL